MKKITLLLLLFIGVTSFSQKLNFKDVSIEELKETHDEDFPDAPAKVIFRKVEVSFGEEVYVYERIKIYNKNGFEFAKWVISFDNVEALKANTYNLENGEIVFSKVGKEGIFKEDVENGEIINKIVFPNVKQGSVLDIRYRVKDVGVSAIYTQSDIPIKNMLIVISNPYLRELKITENALSDVTLTRTTKKKEIRYKGINIKPLKVEKFMPSYNAYRGALYIEQVAFYGKNKLNEWGEVAKFYNKASWFGKQLKNSKYFKEELQEVVSNQTDELQRAKDIFYFLQKRMISNEYGRGNDNIEKVYKEKKGSVGAINLILTAMLKEEGLDANPLLLASKDQGYVLYPTIYRFNNTITALKINKKTYLLDASNKNAMFGQLQKPFNNGDGLIVYSNNMFELVKTAPNQSSRELNFMNATIDVEKSSISGTVKNKKDGYFAQLFREDFKNKNENAYWNNLQNSYNQFSVSNTTIEQTIENDLPIVMSYDFTCNDCIEEIGDNIYISPLLQFEYQEEFFKEDERRFPVDFSFPKAKTFSINFKIPEGYKVVSVPEILNIAIKDQVGSLVFKTNTIGNILQINLKHSINYTIVGPSYYNGIKALFEAYTKISKSKIVLTKL